MNKRWDSDCRMERNMFLGLSFPSFLCPPCSWPSFDSSSHFHSSPSFAIISHGSQTSWASETPRITLGFWFRALRWDDIHRIVFGIFTLLLNFLFFSATFLPGKTTQKQKACSMDRKASSSTAPWTAGTGRLHRFWGTGHMGGRWMTASDGLVLPRPSHATSNPFNSTFKKVSRFQLLNWTPCPVSFTRKFGML